MISHASSKKKGFREVFQKNESMDFVQTESLDPKIGINRPRPSQDFYLNTTKINTKKIWIWGLTPPPPLDEIHTFIFFFFG